VFVLGVQRCRRDLDQFGAGLVDFLAGGHQMARTRLQSFEGVVKVGIHIPEKYIPGRLTAVLVEG
jgi:hypothetical protein